MLAHAQDFIDARLDDGRQPPVAGDLRLPAGNAVDGNGLVLDRGGQFCVTVPSFEFFGFLESGVQYLGDVCGDAIAAEGDDPRVPHTAVGVYQKVGGTAAHIDERHTLVLLGLIQDGVGRRQRGQYQGFHVQSHGLDAMGDVADTG